MVYIIHFLFLESREWGVKSKPRVWVFLYLKHRHAFKSMKAIAAINHIPAELLSKIFLVCVAVWPSGSEDRYRYLSRSKGPNDFTCGSGLPWIAIAQVCQYWRYTALGCGELWRGLLFSSSKATTKMLRRSHGTNLIVKAQIAESHFDPILKRVRLIIPYLSRVSVLHLALHPSDLQSLLRDLSVAAPNLTSLRLHSRDYYDGKATSFTLPDIIFAGQTPFLRLLDLTNCKFSWTSLPLNNLAHLELCNAARPPTLAQILTFLREVPSLHTFILNEALPIPLLNKRSRNTAIPRLFLPNLRVITLGGSTDACTNLLYYLSYPTDTIATFNCQTSPRDNFGHLLYETQCAVARGREHQVIRDVGIKTWCSQLMLQCYLVPRSSRSLRASPCDEHPQLNVVLKRTRYDGPTFKDCMHAAVVNLPFDGVQTLCIEAIDDVNIDWSEFLKLVGETHTIHFLRRFPPEVVEVMGKDGRKTEEFEQRRPHVLPRLRSMWFEGVDFRMAFRVHSSGSEGLLKFLRSRIEFSPESAIQELHLKNCWYLYECDVDRMKEVVHKVEWDEVEQEEEEYSETGADFEGIDDSG